MDNFKPFDNDSQSLTIGSGNGITFENGLEDIIIYGDTTINSKTDSVVIDRLIEVLTAIKNKLPKK